MTAGKPLLVRALVGALIAGVVSVAPVGLGSASEASAKTECKYLKSSEVRRVVKASVMVTPAPTGIGGACGFLIPSQDSATVSVWVLHGNDARQGYDIGKQLAGKDVETARGLGDKAFYTGEPFDTVYALKGDTLVYLQYYRITGGDPAATKRIVVALTKKALGRT